MSYYLLSDSDVNSERQVCTITGIVGLREWAVLHDVKTLRALLDSGESDDPRGLLAEVARAADERTPADLLVEHTVDGLVTALRSAIRSGATIVTLSAGLAIDDGEPDDGWETGYEPQEDNTSTTDSSEE